MDKGDGFPPSLSILSDATHWGIVCCLVASGVQRKFFKQKSDPNMPSIQKKPYYSTDCQAAQIIALCI
jgi:hypothetical protein